MGTSGAARYLRSAASVFVSGGSLAALLLGACSSNELGSESTTHAFEHHDAAAGALEDVAGPLGTDASSTAVGDASASLDGGGSADAASADAAGIGDGDGSAEGASSKFPPPTCSGWGTSTTAVSVGRTGHVVTGFDDGSVIVRDAALGQLRKIQAHDGPVQGVAISDDGASLVTLGDGELRIWNTADGQKVRSGPYNGWTDVTQVFIAPNQLSLIVLGAPKSLGTYHPPQLPLAWDLSVFDWSTLAVAWLGSDTYPIGSAFFCGAAQDVCVVNGSGLTVHRRADGQTLRSIAGAKGTPSPDGSMIASVARGTLAVTRTTDGMSLFSTTVSYSNTLLFSMDGSVMISLPVNLDVEGWRVPSFTEIDPWTWPDPAWRGNIPAWRIGSARGSSILIDDIAGKLELFDAVAGQLGSTAPTIGQQDAPEVIRFSPDGSLVATLASFNPNPIDHYESPSGSLVVWDAVTHAALWSQPSVGMKGGLNAIAFSPDSKVVYANGIRDARDGHLVRSLADGGGCYAPTPDGSLLYACGRGPYPIEIYDLVAQTQKTMDGGFTSSTLAISPAATSLVVTVKPDNSGSQLGLRMYPLPDGGRAWYADAGDDDENPSIIFSPDGHVLALTKLFSLGVRLFDAGSGQALDVLEASDLVGPVAFSPDGRFLAAATSHGIDLIRFSDRQLVNTLPLVSKIVGVGVRFPPGGVAFSPSGDQLLVGNGYGHIASFCHVLDGL